MKIWKYLYCLNYKIGIKFNKTDPEFASTIGMTLIFTFNVLTIKNIFAMIIGRTLFFEDKKIDGLLILAASFILQYFIFLRDKKYKKILTEFEARSKKGSILDYVFLILVVIATFSLWIYTDSILTEMLAMPK